MQDVTKSTNSEKPSSTFIKPASTTRKTFSFKTLSKTKSIKDPISVSQVINELEFSQDKPSIFNDSKNKSISERNDGNVPDTPKGYKPRISSKEINDVEAKVSFEIDDFDLFDDEFNDESVFKESVEKSDEKINSKEAQDNHKNNVGQSVSDPATVVASEKSKTSSEKLKKSMNCSEEIPVEKCPINIEDLIEPYPYDDDVSESMFTKLE